MADDATQPDVRPDRLRRGPTADLTDRPEIQSSSHVPPPLAPARTLGRYQVLFELARGGMGSVHVARLAGAHGFDRLFAVKCLLRREASPKDVADFLSEARVTAKMDHPNIVPALDLGEHEGAPFLVMPFVPGVSLARLLAELGRRGERMDPWLAAWIAVEIAAGLEAAHTLTDPTAPEPRAPLGVVHRDVSPENILLSFDGRVLVTDFGVAKWRDAARQTTTGATKGKLAYMAPEQARGDTVDPRTDVFAWGAVFYEMLVGQRAFAAKSPAETLERVLHHVPDHPATARRDLPRILGDIAMASLAKAPADRPGSAGEVARALRSASRDERRFADGSDLASALARIFPGEREKLFSQIGSFAADVPAVSRPTEGRPAQRRTVLFAAILALGVGLGAVFWLRDRSGAHDEPSDPSSEPASLSAPSAVSSAGAPLPSTSRPIPDPLPASSASAASARPAPDPTVPNTAPSRAVAAPPKSAAPLPSASSGAPASNKGSPFRTLGL